MSGQANGVTVFVCGRKEDKIKCSTSGCSNLAISACTFKLRGKKAGQTCGRPLCSACDSRGLCVPHQRLMDTKTTT